MSTYSIALWDHDLPSRSGSIHQGGWSDELAREHLDGPNSGLSLGQVATALKKLRRHWGDCSIYLTRDET